MSINIDFDLHYKQGIAFNSNATEILYGGAAGGGKSHLMRIEAIIWCLEIPGLQVYLFRRLSDDLIKNHMEGPSGFRVLLNPLVQSGKAQIIEGEIRFPHNGSKIYLCHCKDEKDRFKYDGPEIHVLLIDELTHFTEKIYRYLRARVRMNQEMKTRLPNKYKGLFPRIVCSSNPGKLGHQWVKRTFIDFAPAQEIVKVESKEGGMLRQYIPALLEDNPSLDTEEYEGRLEGLGNTELVKAMRYGIWDIVAGAAFEHLDRDRHIIRPFDIPDWWTKFTSLDWGTAKPYSNGWYAVVEDDLTIKEKDDWPERHIAKGSIIRYKELYGWNGKPNEGCREEAWQVARKIHAMETETINYRIGDSGMWAQHDGPSAAENFMEELARIGAKNPNMEQSRKDRVANYLECRARLSAEDGKQPGFYTFPNSIHFWRTVPELQLDDKNPEKGPDSTQEDHPFDDWSYAMVSRPIIMDKKTHNRQQYDEAQDKAKKADRGGKINSSRY